MRGGFGHVGVAGGVAVDDGVAVEDFTRVAGPAGHVLVLGSEACDLLLRRDAGRPLLEQLRPVHL